MQAALEVTAKHCAEEMEAYGQCVTSKPSTWQQDCHQLKMKVAECTSSHPVIQKIRSECSAPFASFERCMRENPASMVSCTKHVNQFLACAEKVKVPSLGEGGAASVTGPRVLLTEADSPRSRHEHAATTA
ncbi:coiled-coil-helix-coiled-coil-helix domain-containing protein 5 [Callorhinchus milii]|uniref:Coiled-coil-helix-coiled-coil-helix domain-containing protein 5-like protein n=1 Tax=Callorhinchus milii TaxID=7868 RepID=V9LAV4_CALMI|nr:coiled-coil-helix-coiled-coil-helix domain-containing protein 5 [Callorhinchus milii]|eukprot:gi/632981636/ref/XP_007907701.1/ PREDICTED: coiled-coil-helix-coiled-coil-helix domain-containing protein 5 [Callorhinchus milii]